MIHGMEVTFFTDAAHYVEILINLSIHYDLKIFFSWLKVAQSICEVTSASTTPMCITLHLG